MFILCKIFLFRFSNFVNIPGVAPKLKAKAKEPVQASGTRKTNKLSSTFFQGN